MNSMIKTKEIPFRKPIHIKNKDDYYESIKPNLIHSSNIPYKINALFHHCKQNPSFHRVTIIIRIKLNTLLSRSKDKIGLSHLLKRDLISFIQNKRSDDYLSMILTKSYRQQILLQPKIISDDHFIVSFKLTISEISISSEKDITIQFDENDENYHLIIDFIPQIKLYMRDVIRREISDNENNDDEAKRCFNSDISDSTLECSEEEEDTENKQNCKDLNNDYKVIEPLKSNDTLTDEFRRRYSDISDEEKLLNSNEFINNIENLRHNEEVFTSPTNNLENYSHHLRLDDLPEVECENESFISPQKYTLPSSSSPIKFNNIDDNDDDEYDFTNLIRQTSFQSPTKQRRSISRMTSNHSISLINSDEKFGLEYAFNSPSDVPSYIKDDKKFKFIKVGKVQKFVNLFEEKTGTTSTTGSATTSRITSRVASRVPSRSSSPTRQ